MDNRQLRNIGIILILPIIFAGFGYFGMKIFLSGSGPNTVMPEKSSSSIVTDSEKDTTQDSQKVVDNGSDTTEGKTSENSEQDKPDTTAENNSNKVEQSTTQKENTTTASTPSEPKEESKPMEIYDYNSVNFFSLQVGSYSSLSNAQKHVESLRGEGIEAYVFHGNNYKVMAGVNSSRDGVEALKALVSETIPDAFVKGLVIVPDAMKYPKGTEGVDVFNEIVGAYKLRLDEHIAFVSKLNTGDMQYTKQYLENDLQAIKNIITSIESFNGDESFETSLSKMKNVLNAAEQKVRQKINGELTTMDIFDLYVEEIMSYNRIN